jgi:hypothetical protein
VVDPNAGRVPLADVEPGDPAMHTPASVWNSFDGKLGVDVAGPVSQVFALKSHEEALEPSAVARSPNMAI